MRRLLLQSDRTPNGQLERALLTSAVDISDQIGDELLGYEGRLRLSAWAAAAGDSSTRLRAFDRCLELHLGDPVRFPVSIGDLDLLWDYASIPRLLAASPRYDRETIAGCLDDMLQVFSFQGADLRAFDLARFDVAAATGDEGLAAEALDRVTGRLGAPHAESLVCDACALSAEIAWHAGRGRLDRAVACADRLRESGSGCADEPELGLSRALVPYLLTGRLTDAHAVHLEGYELARHNPKHLEAVAGHIEFAVRVGALQRALGLVERHACWLAVDPLGASAHVAFLAAAGAAMDALTRSGRGAAVVVLRDAPVLPDQLGARVDGWTATSLARACWTAASGLAEAFDARNGNDLFARRLTVARAVRPVTAWELPAAAAVGPAATGERPVDRRLDAPCDLLARARERAAVGDREQAETLIDDALPRADPLTRADLFALRIRMHVERDEIRAAEEQLEQRIDCLIVDDLDADAEVDLLLGLLLFGAPPAGHGPELERALDRASRLGLAAGARLRVAMPLAALRMQEERFAEAETLLTTALDGVESPRRSAALLMVADARFALGHIDRAREAIDLLLGDQIDRVLRASALLRRSTMVFTLHPEIADGAVTVAIDDADRALALFAEVEHCEGVLDACGVLGHLLGRIGSIEGSLEALNTAFHTAERFEHPDAQTMAFRLARALVRADRGDEARALLEDVVDRAEFEGEESARGEVFYWLGHACRHDDDDPAAYCVWSLALEEFARVDDHHASARAGIALGRLLVDNDDPAAVAVLHEAVRRARAAVRAPGGGSAGSDVAAATLLLDALHLLGRAQAACGDPTALHTLDDVATEALALGTFEPLLEASLLESRSRAADDLDQDAEATALARQALGLFERAGDPAGAARLALFGARLLARTGADDEADALFRASLRHGDHAQESGRSTVETRALRDQAARELAALRNSRELAAPSA